MISIKEIIHNATISDIKSCSVKGCNNEIDIILELDIKNISILVPLCSDHAEKINPEKISHEKVNRVRAERSDKGKSHKQYKVDIRRVGDEDILKIG